LLGIASTFSEWVITCKSSSFQGIDMLKLYHIPLSANSRRVWITLLENEPQKLDKAHQQVLSVLNFFESLLGDSAYFGSEFLILGDIAAGTVVPQLPSMGVSLDDYPKLKAWSDRLMARNSWQKTQPSPEAIAASLPQIKALMKAYLM
jgi:glutathione S-transferase